MYIVVVGSVAAGTISTATVAGDSPTPAPAVVAASLAGAEIGAGPNELFHPRPGQIPEPSDLPGAVRTTTLQEDR